MKRELLTALAVAASMSAVWLDASESQAQVQRYYYDWPTMPDSGIAVDWCAEWGSNCGGAAAELYCEIQGHQGAATYSFGGDVGYTQLVNGQICSGWCDTFSRIVCYEFDRDLRPEAVESEEE